MTVATEHRRLLAIGGGGFTSAVEDWPLDEFTLTLTAATRPRICLLPTASGDPEAQIERFYSAFTPLGCDCSHISLFRLGGQGLDLREHLLSRDIVYAAGGSLKNLLALWRVHGVDSLLSEAWQRGVTIAGVSAGAMCWFGTGVTRTHGAPAPASGLGLLPGSLSVHDSSDPDRRSAYRRAIRAGMASGYAADDGVGLVFHGTALAEAVTSRAGGRAARVELAADGEVAERLIEPRLLDADPLAAPAETVSISEFRELSRRRAGA